MSGVVVLTPVTTTVETTIIQSVTSTSTQTATITATAIPDNGGVFLNSTTQIFLIVIIVVLIVGVGLTYRQLKQERKKRECQQERIEKKRDIEKLTKVNLNDEEEG